MEEYLKDPDKWFIEENRSFIYYRPEDWIPIYLL